MLALDLRILHGANFVGDKWLTASALCVSVNAVLLVELLVELLSLSC